MHNTHQMENPGRGCIPYFIDGAWCRVKTATISTNRCEAMRRHGQCVGNLCIVEERKVPEIVVPTELVKVAKGVKVACKRCGMMRTNHSRGLCRYCFAKMRKESPEDMPKPVRGTNKQLRVNPAIPPIVCTDCGQTRQPSPRKAFCEPCYRRRRVAGELPSPARGKKQELNVQRPLTGE